MKQYKLITIICMILLSSIAVNASTICEFQLQIDKDNNVEMQKFYSYASDIPIERKNLDSDYKYIFYDENGMSFLEQKIPVSFFFMTNPPIDVDTADIVVKEVCNQEWDTLTIQKENNEIFKLNVKEYMCDNNGKCENYENYNNCQADCKSGSKDGWCDNVEDGICDSDCSEETDKDCVKKPLAIWKVIIAVLIILLIIGFAIIEYKRK